MSQQRKDLLAVFSALSTACLLNLLDALNRNLVCVGKFFDDDRPGEGCLFHHLSLGRIRNRQQLRLFAAEHPLLDAAACQRVIVGWDAQDADQIIKGAGYESYYPDATYTLTPTYVRKILQVVLRTRNQANAAEQAVLDAAPLHAVLAE